MPDEITTLAQQDTISEKDARRIAGEWSAGLTRTAKKGKGRGFGFAALLRLGALAIALLKKLSALAAGAAVVQTFTLLGQQRWIAIGSGTPPNIPGAQ